MDQVADLRMMLNDFGVSATLTDVSASSSSTVKGVFDNGTELAIQEKKKIPSQLDCYLMTI